MTINAAKCEEAAEYLDLARHAIDEWVPGVDVREELLGELNDYLTDAWISLGDAGVKMPTHPSLEE